MITLTILEQSSGLWKTEIFFYTKLKLKFMIKKKFAWLQNNNLVQKNILPKRKIILGILEQGSGLSEKSNIFWTLN